MDNNSILITGEVWWDRLSLLQVLIRIREISNHYVRFQRVARLETAKGHKRDIPFMVLTNKDGSNLTEQIPLN